MSNKQDDSKMIRFSAETESTKDLLDKMEVALVPHKKFMDAYDSAMAAIQHENADTIVAVVAPSGAGKTSLAKCFAKEIKRHFRTKGLKSGQIPVVSLEAEAGERHTFQWRPFYHQWLVALDEPLVSQKIDLAAALKQLQADKDGRKVYNIHRDDLGFLRGQIRRSLEDHSTFATIIDEANHFAMVGRDGSYSGQMNLLKSHANRIACRIVMLGTGEMIPLLDQSAQLGRRVVEISLPPYGRNEDDLREFGNTVLSLLERGPIPHDVSLAKELMYFYEGSVGLIGVMASWIRKSFARAMLAKAPKLTLAHIKACAAPARKLRLLQTEIDLCEAYFEGAATASNAAPQQPAEPQPKKPLGQRRPGRRKAHRDPVGNIAKVRK